MLSRTPFAPGLALLVLLALAVPGPAHAVPPLLQVTACEPVPTGDHTGQSLTLAIAGQSQFYDSALLLPRPAGGLDTCSIVDFTPPPDWQAMRGDRGSVLFFGPPVDLGQSLDGFRVTLGDVHGCLEVNLSNFLILDSPGYGVACFDQCLATPAHAATWGGLKAIYR